MYYTLILTFTIIIINGCAHIKPSNSLGEKNVSAKKQTPTTIINNYKDSTAKRGLDSAIQTGSIQKKDESFLKNHQSKKYKFWVNYFTTRNKNGFERFAKNGERYRKIIEDTFEKYGLPKDLYYVGLIESGYLNHARSHADAVGPWQFIKETGRRYGLKVTRSIDERKNIYKSTQAAALYFQDLYNIFGSWELALAAYNAGEYGIIRRIRGANTRKYYELSAKKIIPKETRNYVPKVLAAMYVYKNAKKYNIKIAKPKNNFYSATKSIKINKSISLSKLSNKIKVPTHTLKQLNHDLKGDNLPYMGKQGFDLYIPDYKSISKSTERQLAQYSKNKARKTISKTKRITSYKTSKVHKVRSNESLFSISKRYNVRISTLKRLNKINGSKIFIGQKIYLSTKSTATTKYSYIVKKGDNLTKIATLFDTGIKKLVHLNKLSKKQIYAGQKLKVPAHTKKTYTVKAGDNLSSISNRTKTNIKELKKLNNLRSTAIYPGQSLVVKISML